MITYGHSNSYITSSSYLSPGLKTPQSFDINTLLVLVKDIDKIC